MRTGRSAAGGQRMSAFAEDRTSATRFYNQRISLLNFNGRQFGWEPHPGYGTFPFGFGSRPDMRMMKISTSATAL